MLPLSDALQWNLPQYDSVIKLISVAGQTGKLLVARSAAGLVLYKLTKGSVKGVDLSAGTWTQLTTTGPFADSDCFTNQKCWSDASYYQTIRFGDIDGQPGAEVIGWGGDGIVAFKWNGSGWTSLTGLPRAGDAGANGPSSYLPLQLADVDGEARAELLLSLAVRRFSLSHRWHPAPGSSPPRVPEGHSVCTSLARRLPRCS